MDSIKIALIRKKKEEIGIIEGCKIKEKEETEAIEEKEETEKKEKGKEKIQDKEEAIEKDEKIQDKEEAIEKDEKIQANKGNVIIQEKEVKDIEIKDSKAENFIQELLFGLNDFVANLGFKLEVLHFDGVSDGITALRDPDLKLVLIENHISTHRDIFRLFRGPEFKDRECVPILLFSYSWKKKWKMLNKLEMDLIVDDCEGSIIYKLIRNDEDSLMENEVKVDSEDSCSRMGVLDLSGDSSHSDNFSILEGRFEDEGEDQEVNSFDDSVLDKTKRVRSGAKVKRIQ